MIWKMKIMKRVKLTIFYQGSKGVKRIISTMDVYFVAVITVKEMVLIVHIFAMYYPKPKNLKNQITIILVYDGGILIIKLLIYDQIINDFMY